MRPIPPQIPFDFGPENVDVTDELKSTFGCVEFEEAACRILKFLTGPRPAAPCGLGHDWGDGWARKFRIDTIPGVDPTMFAMLAASGWLEHIWFPKGAFLVSGEFIKRLYARHQKQGTPPVLKPCPFCAATDKTTIFGEMTPAVGLSGYSGGYRVECAHCGTCGPFIDNPNHSKAITAWNNRPLSQSTRDENSGTMSGAY